MHLKNILILLCLGVFYSCASKAIEFAPEADCSTRRHMTLEILNSHPSFKFDSNELSQWMHSKQHQTNAVALLIHGLNLRPSKMNSLGHFLSSEGIDTLRVSLAGHRGSKSEQKKVTRDQWVNQFRDHYCLAQKRAEQLKVPLYLIGYSLGALVPLDFMNSAEYKLGIEKMVLLAPAIKVHWYSHIPSAFSFLGGMVSLPSANLKEYRSQNSTSLAAYGAMADSRNNLKKASKQRLNLPTLILTDPDDELVSPSKIDQMIEEIGLSKWKHKPLDNSKSELKKTFDHLIIDRPTLGKAEWERVLGLIRDHLKP